MRRLKKTMIYLSLFIAVCFIFTGCAQKKTVKYTSKKYRIGFAMPTYDDVFLSKLMNSAKKEAEKLTDADVIFVNAKNDSTKQTSQVVNLIAQKCNVIIVCPVDNKKGSEYITMAKNANIPIISVNRKFNNQSDLSAYVGSESITAGTMEMEYIAKKLNGKGNIVILRGEDSEEAAIKRTEGIKQVLKNYPDIKVVAEETGKWQRALAMQITEGWIKSNVKFDAVVSNNDEMAIGAIMALKESNMQGKVLVGGVDATSDALKLMKEGTLTVTIFQNAAGQGSEAINAAYKMAKGEKVDDNVLVPYELVTPDNSDKYLKK